MAEDSTDVDEVCEEPSADFFDTFFDDGVLDTIEEVFDADSDGSSSCEVLDVHLAEDTVNRANNDHKLDPKAPSKSSVSSKECSNREEKIIVLKPAHIKEEYINQRGKSSSKECGRANTASSGLPKAGFDPNQFNNLKASDGTGCETNKSPGDAGVISVSDEDSSLIHDIMASKYSSINEIVVKVQKILKETPISKKSNEKQVTSDVQGAGFNSSGTLEEETRDVMKMVKECLSSPPAINMTANCRTEACDNSESKLDQSERDALRADKSQASDGKIHEIDSTKCDSSNLSDQHKTDQVLSPNSVEKIKTIDDQSQKSTKYLETDAGVEKPTPLKEKVTEEDPGKENDLTLEETFPKKKSSQSSPVKKINLNLKSQILAATTILNSKTHEKPVSSSHDVSKDKKIKDTSSQSKLGSKEPHGLSSLSDDSCAEKSESTQKIRKKKRKRDHSSGRKSVSPDRERSKRQSREHKEKRRRRGDSISSSRRKDPTKSKSKPKRPRSRSHSPGYKSKRKVVRDRSPRYESRPKRRRSLSKSPSPAPSRRYVRRSSPSPTHFRSRSRSPSSTRRSWKSPSPRARRRRQSRSRSRSPFINEICRLKKQWAIEDQVKRTSEYPDHHTGLLPPIESWSQAGPSSTTMREGHATTIVSNMLVSVESVQVHSTAYSVGSSMGISASNFETGSGGPYLPPHFSAPFGSPNYVSPSNAPQIDNRPSLLGIPPPPMVSEIIPPPPMVSEIIPPPPMLLSRSVPPLRMLPGIPGEEGNVLESEDSTGHELQTGISCSGPLFHQSALHPHLQASGPSAVPQTSILRKQLDILKSSVVSLPELRTGTKAASQSLVQITCKENVSAVNSVSKSVTKRPIQPDKPCSVPDVHGQINSDPQETTLPVSQSVCNSVSLESVSSSSCEPSSQPCVLSQSNQSSLSSPLICEVVEPKDGSSKDHPDPATSSRATEVEHPDTVRVSVESGSCIDHVTVKGENEDASSQTREYDSDVIIEEPPPKPPIELICLSGDETDINANSSTIDMVPSQTLHPDPESKESSCSKPTKGHQQPTPKTAPVKAAPISKPSNEKGSSKTKRRNSKKRKRLAALRKERAKSTKDAGSSKTSDGTSIHEISEDNPDENRMSILQECHDMIDSLRIGRFVVIDEDEAPEPTADSCQEKFKSALSRIHRIELSYTQKPKLEDSPKSKDVSTNTAFRLCLDVCTGTSDDVQAKDCMTQTDMDCFKCHEMKEVLKAVNDEMLQLTREKEALQAIIDGMRRSSSIPGLDFSLDDVEPPSGSHGVDTSVNKIPAGDQQDQLLEERTPSTFSPVHSMQTEPVLSFEYNHSSPGRHSIL